MIDDPVHLTVQIVCKYMDLAIEFDQPFVVTKYNLQQLLGGEQANPEFGPRFLASGTMADLADIFHKLDQYLARQVREPGHRTVCGRELMVSVQMGSGGTAIIREKISNFQISNISIPHHKTFLIYPKHQTWPVPISGWVGGNHELDPLFRYIHCKLCDFIHRLNKKWWRTEKAFFTQKFIFFTSIA